MTRQIQFRQYLQKGSDRQINKCIIILQNMMKKGQKRYAITSMTFNKNPKESDSTTESNLIFKHHSKAKSCFPHQKNINVSQKLNSRSIDKMKFDKKRLSNPENSQRNEINQVESSEVGKKNSSQSQMNIINLLRGNIIEQKEMKSNYCKRITLSNVNKYYEYCLKKVQGKTFISQELQSSEGFSSQPFSLSENLRNNPLFFEEHLLRFEVAGERPNYQNPIGNYREDQNDHKKRNNSFFCRRPKTFQNSRNLKMKATKEPEEFKLEGWQSTDNPEQILI